ncbi:MAG TPA: S9 family peptidase [Dermatophilaceae bacterium]|nr:S9 family peptidase [Dermatophilaceae bacterium]
MPTPPRARRIPRLREHHGRRFQDPYDWLRDADNPDVLDHLRAENAYADAMTEHLEPLRQRLFDELKARTQETDMSVPVAYRGWWYYSRSFEGRQYAAQCRLPVIPGEPRPTLEGPAPDAEQVLLDGNVEAAGHEFLAVGDLEVSHDGDLLAYSLDLAGDERFALRVREVGTGRVLDDSVRDIGYGVVWSLDNRYLFYTRLDQAWRPYQVWRHEVGRPATKDVLVFEETDERFWVGVGASRDDQQVIVAAGSKTTSETWLLHADAPTDPLRCVTPRRDGVEYDVEPAGDRLVITHNADHPDFSVSQAPLGCTSAEQWTPLLPTVTGERMLGVDAFRDHLVLSLRKDGLTGLRVLPRAGDGFGQQFDLSFDEPLYTVGVGANPDYDASVLQIGYESLVTPRTVSEYDIAGRTLTLLKQQPVLGGYDPAGYVQRREWATATDGTLVPVSLVYKASTPLDGTAPGYLYGYGAYETSMDPWFSVGRLSLLDRGFVYAVAHVRGGGEMGRSWYEQGRLEHKATTFTDFLAVADHLVGRGLVHPKRLVAEGGSAGGLLIGAAVNLAPDRFAAALAGAPFVDPLTTILDPTLPLTVVEWEEWGDPLHDPAAYARMARYAPYENVGHADYPAVLATTSLHDTRVSFAEPAKWVQMLRDRVTGDRPVLLRTQIVAGHTGRSGRYDVWREHAWELAFLIDQVSAWELVSS